MSIEVLSSRKFQRTQKNEFKVTIEWKGKGEFSPFDDENSMHFMYNLYLELLTLKKLNAISAIQIKLLIKFLVKTCVSFFTMIHLLPDSYKD